MPEYKKIRAKSLRQARELAFKEYGSNISIVKEIIQRPKGWKKLLNLGESFCEIVVARYSNRKDLTLDNSYTGSLKDFDRNVDDFPLVDSLDKKKEEKKRNDKGFRLVAEGLLTKKRNIDKKYKKEDLAEMLNKKGEQMAFHFGELKNFEKVINVEEKSLQKSRGLDRSLESSFVVNEECQEKVGVIEDFLLKNKFDRSLAKDVGNICLVKDLNSTENLKHLAFTLSSRFSFDKDFFHSDSKQFFFFLGAPGVGKTTSVFKVAVELAKKQKRDVFLACYDQNRLMAATQMEKFSDILEIPFRRLEGVDCLRRLKKECVKGSVVLVDLAGISLSEKNQLKECHELMNVVADQKKVLLTLHSAMSAEVLSLQMEMFLNVDVDALSFSHVDEVQNLGSILSTADRFKKPIALFCFGQDVPHDMCWGDKENLERFLLNSWMSKEIVSW